MKKSQQFSTRRLEALTDGVFAIAMTLLVLDLAVPASAEIVSSGDLWRALEPLGGSFISFVISFVILAAVWAAHLRQFENIKAIDNRALTYNNLRLFLVVVIPFVTSLVGDYGDTLLARVLYPATLLALGVVTYVQGRYLAKHPSFFRDFDAKSAARSNQRSLAFVITALLVTIAAIPLGSTAYFGFFLNPVMAYLLVKYGSRL